MMWEEFVLISFNAHWEREDTDTEVKWSEKSLYWYLNARWEMEDTNWDLNVLGFYSSFKWVEMGAVR